MLRAQATLTAGPNQGRYSPGAKVRAVVYARLESPKQFNVRIFKSLADRGWARITLDSCARVLDPKRVIASHSTEAEACRLAATTGFGIVVLGLVQ